MRFFELIEVCVSGLQGKPLTVDQSYGHIGTHLLQTIVTDLHALDRKLLPVLHVFPTNDFAESPLALFTN